MTWYYRLLCQMGTTDDVYNIQNNYYTYTLQQKKLLLILKLYVLQELFPLMVGKRIAFHAYFNENNIYIGNRTKSPP